MLHGDQALGSEQTVQPQSLEGTNEKQKMWLIKYINDIIPTRK